MTTTPEFWRKCSSCKKPISFQTRYYECSVSTCTGLRTGYVFCSVPCWEVHLPGAKHRDAGAVEKKSPTRAEFEVQQSAQGSSAGGEGSTSVAANSAASLNHSPTESQSSAPSGRRIIVGSPTNNPSAVTSNRKTSSMSQEVLVVVSKMKQYIRDMSEMNTSEDVNKILSDKIRIECDKAIEKARADGRKTVMARDFK